MCILGNNQAGLISWLDELDLSSLIKRSSSHTILLASQAEDGSWLDWLDRLDSWGYWEGFEPAGACAIPSFATSYSIQQPPKILDIAAIFASIVVVIILSPPCRQKKTRR
jgi:hypothetical protein